MVSSSILHRIAASAENAAIGLIRGLGGLNALDHKLVIGNGFDVSKVIVKQNRIVGPKRIIGPNRSGSTYAGLPNGPSAGIEEKHVFSVKDGLAIVNIAGEHRIVHGKAKEFTWDKDSHDEYPRSDYIVLRYDIKTGDEETLYQKTTNHDVVKLKNFKLSQWVEGELEYIKSSSDRIPEIQEYNSIVIAQINFQDATDFATVEIVDKRPTLILDIARLHAKNIYLNHMGNIENYLSRTCLVKHDYTDHLTDIYTNKTIAYLKSSTSLDNKVIEPVQGRIIDISHLGNKVIFENGPLEDVYDSTDRPCAYNYKQKQWLLKDPITFNRSMHYQSFTLYYLTLAPFELEP